MIGTARSWRQVSFWEIRGPEKLPEGLNKMLSNRICLELVSHAQMHKRGWRKRSTKAG